MSNEVLHAGEPHAERGGHRAPARIKRWLGRIFKIPENLNPSTAVENLSLVHLRERLDAVAGKKD
jgi:hypothetical protein